MGGVEVRWGHKIEEKVERIGVEGVEWDDDGCDDDEEEEEDDDGRVYMK